MHIDYGLWFAVGIRVVGKNEKLESFILESFAEDGKNRLKLEKTERSWKEPSEVGKFRCSWKVVTEVGKFTICLLYTSDAADE